MIYGYARVSTEGQSVEVQREALTAAGAVRIFMETASGARKDRPQLQKALAALKPGDVLLVTRLDRLARSTLQLLNSIEAVAQRGASFRSLADTWADTTTPHGRLMLTVLGGLAEFERDLISTRTGEGRALAKGRGVKFGRKAKMTPHQQAEAIERWKSGESASAIARSYNVTHPVISRLVRPARDEQSRAELSTEPA
jgi:DNA invertase Pin-like site-specific DNA recombinase